MKSCKMSTMAFWMPMMMWEKTMGHTMGPRSTASRHGGSVAQNRCCESSTATSPGRPGKAGTARDIVDVATDSGLFTRLVDALQKAGLAETLKGEGPFTVFAPSDEAFSKIPKKTLDAILADADKLKSVLTYHVVPGRYASDTLAGIDALRTVQGTPLKIDTSVGVRAGNAQVIKADVAAGNGVIHVIDSVLLPE